MKINYTARLSVSFIIILSLLFLMPGCGENEQSPSSETKETKSQPGGEAQSVSACSLLTESDAKTILGNAVQPGIQTESMCQYVSAAEELSKTGENVSVTLHKNAGSDFDKYVTDTETSTGIKPEPIQGIGQKAAWADGSLIVQQSADLLVIIVGKKMDKEAHIAAARTLAATIISRM